tara:strand:+ start:923 stop:1354 length:432 start_codon:yes stop_codon:yes gene_type:complete
MIKFFKILLAIVLCFIFHYSIVFSSDEKVKIGLLVPMTGDNKNLGQLLIKSTRLALEDIDKKQIEIYPKDTASNPNQTLKSAFEFKQEGIKIVIGPVFYDNLIYLKEVEEIIFLSLTNKTINLPKNVISTGVNSTSQLNTIKK